MPTTITASPTTSRPRRVVRNVDALVRTIIGEGRSGGDGAVRPAPRSHAPPPASVSRTWETSQAASAAVITPTVAMPTSISTTATIRPSKVTG